MRLLARHRISSAHLCVLVVLAAIGGSCHETEPTPQRIVLVIVDTLRRDFVSAYGSTNPTPHIDALAAKGQLFTNALAAFHQTSMSMASLFTGKTPSVESKAIDEPLAWNGSNWCGMRRFAPSTPNPQCVPASLTTLAEALSQAGYWTAAVASNPLMFRPFGYDQGFDEWVEVGRDLALDSPLDPANREATRAWRSQNRESRSASHVLHAVERVLESRPTDRFFLYVHLMDAHDRDRGTAYVPAVAAADLGVGRLVELLERRGLIEGSTVFLVSDHGERLRDRHFVKGTPSHSGNPSFDELLRIPMITAPAVVTDPSVALRSDDVYRLIRQAAGVPDAEASELEPGELLLTEGRYVTYRTGAWKSYLERETGRHHLIDLRTDPRELRDVAYDHADVLVAHRRRIDELRTDLAAPDASPTRLSPDDERRLRALGYLE